MIGIIENENEIEINLAIIAVAYSQYDASQCLSLPQTEVW